MSTTPINTVNANTMATPVSRARTLGPTIAAACAAIESDRRLTPAVMQGLYDTGLLRLLLPRSAGGEEVTPNDYLHAVMTLSQYDSSVGWNVFVANSAAIIAAFLEPDVAREIFAPPQALVSWGPPNHYRAQATDQGYAVNGQWAFASGCRHATWMGIHCQVEEADGTLRCNAAGTPVIRTLLFPAERAALIDNWHTIGLRGTASDGYSVSDLHVAHAYSTTREEPESRREQGPLYAIPMQGLYAVGVAGVACGIARAMLDDFVELAQDKTPRGQVRLAENPSVQADIARCEASLSASLCWLDRVLEQTHDDVTRQPTPAIDVPARARVRLACSHLIQSAIDVADKIYRLAGVSTIFCGTPMERRFRDIHTVSQQIQSRPGHFETVGKVLLGTPPAVFF
jgi:alkylation response protein AidB-like acyl-CoA dehydrogenase